MAANVKVYEVNGATPGTPTDKTSGVVRFKNVDETAVDLQNPLPIPTSNTQFSFQKWLRLRIDGGSFTQVSNLRAYMDGIEGFQAGSPSTVKVWSATAPAYVQPVQPAGTIDPPQYPASGSPTTNMTNLFLASSASPIDLDAINTGPFTNGSPLEWIGDFLILVMEVEVGTVSGVTNAETLTFAWDEI